MIKRLFTFLGLLVLLLSVPLAAGGLIGEARLDKMPSDVLQSCTIFAASYGNTVLFGNNEDTTRRPSGAYWVTSASQGNYAVLYVGWADIMNMCMGGVNEKGLACDANRLLNFPLNPHPEKPSFAGWIMAEILPKCANVQEVIDMVQKHNWENPAWYQVLFADATGDMVVVSAGTDGEIAFTRKAPEDCFLVSTNFNRAISYSGLSPCPRYNKAVEILRTIKSERDLTVNLFRSILDATHQEGLPVNTTLDGNPLVRQVNTTYSNIFDLKNGIAYFYYHHQFNQVVKVDVKKELARGAHVVDFMDLFPRKTLDQAAAEYKKYAEDPTAYLDRILGDETPEEKGIDLKLVLFPVVGVAVLAGAGLMVYRKILTRRMKAQTAEQGQAENQR